MANRYWVGGTDNWNATAGSKWSTTSGGAGGAAVPTAADDVYIDANAGGNVTIPTATNVTCRSLNFVDGTGGAYTGTFTHASTSANIQIGDGTAGASNVALKLSSGMTYTLTGIGTITLQSTNSTTQTITSNGKTLPNITINGSGSNYQFADACTSSGNLVYTTGASIDFNSLNHTFSSFNISGNSNTRTVTWGTAILNCTLFGGTPITASGASNVTISASVGAQLNASNSNGPSINLGSLNWGNVAIAHTTSGTSNAFITSSGATIYSYTRTGSANKTEVVRFTAGGSVTISNSLTIAGNSTTNRILVDTGTAGSTFTITNNGSNTISNADFMDITGAGSVSWDLSAITGNSGDCGGNSGITFTTPAAQQYDGTAGNWSTAARWTSRVPLPQDDVTFATSSAAVSLDMPRAGKNVDFTNYSGTLTWTTGLGQTFYGSVTISSGMTLSFGNTVNWVMAGRGSHTFDSAGKTFTGTNMSTTVTAPGGTYTLASAYTTGHGFVLSAGTFDTGNYTVTSTAFSNGGTVTRTLTLGSSTWNLTSTSGSPWSWTGTGATLNAGTSTIALTTASASARTFTGGSLKYYTFTYTVAGSTGQLTVGGSNYFDTFNFTDSTNARTLLLTLSTTQTIRVLNASGASGRLISINSTSAGSPAYLDLVGPVNTLDWLSVKDIFASIPYKFYAGANSTNVSGNTNVTFTAPVTQPYVDKKAESFATTTSLTATLPFGQTATAGNLLVVLYTASTNPTAVTTPAGYTLIDASQGTSSAYTYTYYKIAAGGETSVTLATTASVIGAANLIEVAGFTGTPTFDVSDKNNSGSSSVTTLSTGSGATNTAQPAIAFAFVGMSGGNGSFTSLTNSFQQMRLAVQSGTSFQGVLPLSTTGSVSTTFTWVTSRVAATQLVIFKDVASGAAFQPMTAMFM